jgi:hypothetical protein
VGEDKPNVLSSRHAGLPDWGGCDDMDHADTRRISGLEKRIKDLNEKFSQTLLFLSFALIVVATLEDKATPETHSALTRVAWWWTLSLFPILVGILPVIDFCERNLCWYSFVRGAKVVLLWVAVICIGIGAWRFFQTI